MAPFPPAHTSPYPDADTDAATAKAGPRIALPQPGNAKVKPEIAVPELENAKVGLGIAVPELGNATVGLRIAVPELQIATPEPRIAVGDAATVNVDAEIASVDADGGWVLARRASRREPVLSTKGAAPSQPRATPWAHAPLTGQP